MSKQTKSADVYLLAQTPDAEAGWDMAISMLKDAATYVRGGTDHDFAIRDLIRIELCRHAAWKAAHDTPSQGDTAHE